MSPIAAVLIAALIFGSTALADVPSTGPVNSLAIVMVDLTDGSTWTLGDGGIGRPFEVRIILANKSNGPIKLWSPDNTEGAQCASVVLTSADGSQIALTPGPIKRTGIATTFTIQPHQTSILKLDLLRLIDHRSLPPGKYKLQAFYRNDRPSADTAQGVWTGSLASHVREIEIARPQ